jgi:hypothetical protein
MGLGGVRVCAFYEDMIKEGISAIPERDTQAAGDYGDFSGRASIYSGVQEWVFVALQPDNAKVVRFLFTSYPKVVPTSILLMTAATTQIAHTSNDAHQVRIERLFRQQCCSCA